MTVVNPSALPYKRVCGNCKLGDIYRQQSGNYHCNLCKLDAPCSFVIHINATIAIEDAHSVAAFVSAIWIEAVDVHLQQGSKRIHKGKNSAVVRRKEAMQVRQESRSLRERKRRWPGKRRRPKEKGSATRGRRRLQAQGDREREVTEGDIMGTAFMGPTRT